MTYGKLRYLFSIGFFNTQNFCQFPRFLLSIKTNIIKLRKIGIKRLQCSVIPNPIIKALLNDEQ